MPQSSTTDTRITSAIDKLELEPPQGGIKKLQGQENAYRLRVRNYRILYKEKATCITVYKIALRGQAYKE